MSEPNGKTFKSLALNGRQTRYKLHFRSKLSSLLRQGVNDCSKMFHRGRVGFAKLHTAILRSILGQVVLPYMGKTTYPNTDRKMVVGSFANTTLPLWNTIRQRVLVKVQVNLKSKYHLCNKAIQILTMKCSQDFYGANVLKLFVNLSYEWANKLECLSLTSFSNLV